MAISLSPFLYNFSLRHDVDDCEYEGSAFTHPYPLPGGEFPLNTGQEFPSWEVGLLRSKK